MRTLIIVMIVLLVAFTGVMIALIRIEAEEDRRIIDEADSSGSEETGSRDEG